MSAHVRVSGSITHGASSASAARPSATILCSTRSAAPARSAKPRTSRRTAPKNKKAFAPPEGATVVDLLDSDEDGAAAYDGGARRRARPQTRLRGV